jgi:hypothetical protein
MEIIYNIAAYTVITVQYIADTQEKILFSLCHTHFYPPAVKVFGSGSNVR